MKILSKIRKTVILLVVAAAFLLLPANQTEAATNVITQTKSTRVSAGKLVKKTKGIRYRYKGGSFAKNKWLYVGGKVYYFSAAGYAETGWFVYNKRTYYADTNGSVSYGRWLTLNGKKYYLKSNGVRASSQWVKKGGKYYYFNARGVMQKKRQIAIGSKYYYVGADGARKDNCWVTQKGKKYYFGKNGIRCQSKWVKYKGKYYYLQKDGVMATDTWVGSYYVGSDGARMTSCQVGNYYLDETGKRTKILKFSGKYLFVGDSRVVGMGSLVSASESKFIGEISMGYNWLVSTAGTQVEGYLRGNSDLTVIFAFGVNDMGNISLYISYYQALLKKFPDVKFYFLSVNPVNDSLAASNGYQVKNAQIKAFNKQLKSAFGSRYINTCSYLTRNGFETTDGVHYTAATYQKLYKYVVSKVAA